MPPRRSIPHHYQITTIATTTRPPRQKESYITILRYAISLILLLFACYYLCRVLFLIIHIFLHITSAYLAHPCPWQTKENWRKRQTKKLHILYKKTRIWKKNMDRIIRDIPVMSLLSWRFPHHHHHASSPWPSQMTSVTHTVSQMKSIPCVSTMLSSWEKIYISLSSIYVIVFVIFVIDMTMIIPFSKFIITIPSTKRPLSRLDHTQQFFFTHIIHTPCHP